MLSTIFNFPSVCVCTCFCATALPCQSLPGTGVSILRVDSAAPGDFVRVGGTACGGGGIRDTTFWPVSAGV